MVRASHLALAATALLALSACATTETTSPPPAASVDAVSPDASVYGLYLAGQAALDAGDIHSAADLFGRASAKTPDATYLKDRVFTSALMAGDVTRAAALSPPADSSEQGERILGVLTRSVEALAAGRGEEAYEALSHAGDMSRSEAALALLKPWAAAAAGQAEASVTMPSLDDRLTRLIGSIDQGLLMERAHRYGEAETTFKALLNDPAGLPLVVASYGPFLERRGRRQEAVGLYDQVLAATPDDADLVSARARAAARGAAPPAPTVREGAAEALMVPAAIAMTNKEQEVGLIYLRLTLRLNPGQAEAWLLVGDALSGLGDTAGARAAFAEVAPKSSHYVDARTRLAWSYQSGDDKDQALKLAQETVQQRPDSQDAKLTLADMLRANDQFEASAKMLDPVIAAQGERAEWRLYYMRGVALERAGHWPEAERDLQKALAMKPNQPEVLNYLGYSWVNRGIHIPDGVQMIQQALVAEPDEGAYVDSLGWAYFHLGDFKKAVELLERAATLDAGDAEINDHLGDAYWRAGRHDEARFQWRAVLTMKPPADIQAHAQTKLDSPEGLDGLDKPATVAAK